MKSSDGIESWRMLAATSKQSPAEVKCDFRGRRNFAKDEHVLMHLETTGRFRCHLTTTSPVADVASFTPDRSDFARGPSTRMDLDRNSALTSLALIA